MVIKKFNDDKGYSICSMCEALKVSRSGYYKWLKMGSIEEQSENDIISSEIIRIYTETKGIYGVRRITQALNRELKSKYNVKRIRRLMRRLGLQSVIRRKGKNYVPSVPQVTADNILNRDFSAEKSNQKWLTNVTEFKYGISGKAYLSAILDLWNNSIVSFVLGHKNNNNLVFKTFKLAMEENPGVKPLFHSDRGFQYTSKAFKSMLDEAGCTQSMSRVSKCIDNGPMEGFWGILKSEMYYLNKFQSYEALEEAVKEYIFFYNHKRYQTKYKGLAPFEVRSQAIVA